MTQPNIQVSTTAVPPHEVECDQLVVGAHQAEDGYALTPAASELDARMTGALRSYLDAARYEAKAGQLRSMPSGGAAAAAIITVVGLGKPDDVVLDTLRKASGSAVKAAHKLSRVATALCEAWPDAAAASRAVAEGSLLGSYKFAAYKSEDPSSKVGEVVLVGGDPDGAARGATLARAALLARDLANTPAGDLTPTLLAERAAAVAEESGLTCDVWGRERIVQERLGGLVAVAAGSVEEPRLIRLEYVPDAPRATLALVGKGITFDSGGLSLKTAEGMETMKTDMSGGAAVIAAMSALRDVGSDVRVVAFVPATENMPSGSATKPGDVFRARSGKSVEVLNTDAEGRLVLADALCLAAELEPDAIVDVATLTGACMVGLGLRYAGLVTNDDSLARQVGEAAGRAGEHVWRLPLAREYRKQLDSEVADMKNIGTRYGGAITAALFLSEFVADVPWAHLDIAGPARYESDEPYVPKGASGFATRTLLELVTSFEPPRTETPSQPSQ